MTELRAALVDALGPLYRIEREVRPVGDQRMFVATEITPADGPELLVKVLPASLSLAVDAARFEREVLLLASGLKHPNLVSPRGAGRAGSCIYHTRPFVSGTTLRAWLANTGPVPIARAVEILHGVVTGLAHAHAAKIAHGDLKLEYILLTDEGARLADTGISTAIERSLAAPPPTPLRPAGAAARNDMVTLSALTYEMLTGRPRRAAGEPLERTRALPAWLADWIHAEWNDAAQALAAMRPPPPPPRPSGPRFTQPVV
ncbi:MAG: protein kinase domain-containing protein [Gemmatimonadales bacterium]